MLSFSLILIIFLQIIESSSSFYVCIVHHHISTVATLSPEWINKYRSTLQMITFVRVVKSSRVSFTLLVSWLATVVSWLATGYYSKMIHQNFSQIATNKLKICETHQQIYFSLLNNTIIRGRETDRLQRRVNDHMSNTSALTKM